MQQILTVCLAVAGRAFPGPRRGFAADIAAPLVAPVAALIAVLDRRRELWLAAVCALAFTGVAGAADLALPVVAPAPVFSWTGVYLGIGGGTGWGNNEYNWNQDATLADTDPAGANLRYRHSGRIVALLVAGNTEACAKGRVTEGQVYTDY